MADRLWAFIDDTARLFSEELGRDLREPLKVVGHLPMGDGGLPEGMKTTRYGRVLRRADDEVLYQGFASDDRVGPFLLRMQVKNTPSLGPVLPLRLDLGGRLKGAVEGVARLAAVKGDPMGRRYAGVATKAGAMFGDKATPPKNALAEALNADPTGRRLMAALPSHCEWEAQSLTLQVRHGGELVGRGDHTLAQVSWVPVLSAGFSTFNVNFHLKDAFLLLKLIAATLPDVAAPNPPTARPTGDLAFFKDMDKLGSMGLPAHASQAREVLDHLVDLLRHDRGEDAVWPLLSSDSPLRRKGEVARLRETLRIHHGKDAYRLKSVDWRYSGLKEAVALLTTPSGPWTARMKKGDRRWEITSIEVG